MTVTFRLSLVAAAFGQLACAGARALLPMCRSARSSPGLAPGETALVGDDGLLVTFESVTEDSRCPLDATCIWAGQVVVAVAAGHRVARPYSLKPDETVAVDGYRLRVVRVEPYPASAGIPPSAYRVTFVVVRE